MLRDSTVTMQADLAVYDASAPDLADARALLLSLSAVIGK